MAAQLKAAEAAAAQAEAALATARTNLAYTTIRSPVSGTVITRNIDVGQTVAAAFAAPTLFLIGEDLTKMQVDTNIAEADVGRLAPGMTATFTVDAYPAEIFTGKIREVRNSPQVIQNVVTYDAVIDVDNTALKLKPGMTANIEVVYAERADGAARRERRASASARPRVSWARSLPRSRSIARWSGCGAAALPTPVLFKPGVSDGVVTEVVEGDLQAGDQVITEVISRPIGRRADPVSGRHGTATHRARPRHQGLHPGRGGGARARTTSRSRCRAASSSPSWAPRARASRRS